MPYITVESGVLSDTQKEELIKPHKIPFRSSMGRDISRAPTENPSLLLNSPWRSQPPVIRISFS